MRRVSFLLSKVLQCTAGMASWLLQVLLSLFLHRLVKVAFSESFKRASNAGLLGCWTGSVLAWKRMFSSVTLSRGTSSVIMQLVLVESTSSSVQFASSGIVQNMSWLGSWWHRAVPSQTVHFRSLPGVGEGEGEGEGEGDGAILSTLMAIRFLLQ